MTLGFGWHDSIVRTQIKQFALPSDDKPDHNHEPDGDEKDEGADNLIAGEAHAKRCDSVEP